MKRILIIFLLSSVLYAQVSISQPRPINVPAIHNGKIAYLVTQLWHEELDTPKKLEIIAAKNDSPENLLKLYYSLLRSGNILNVKELFAKGDGSYKKIEEILTKNSDHFEGYKNLSSVHILFSTYWGPYNALGVRLSDGNESMDWREEIVCINNNCKLSIKINLTDQEDRLFETIEFFTRVFLKDPSNLNKGKEAIQDVISNVSPLIVLPKSSSLLGTDKQYPLRIYARISEYPENIIYDVVSDEWNKDLVNEELLPIRNLIHDVNQSEFELSNNSNEALAKNNEIISNLMQSHFVGFNQVESMFMNDLIDDEISKIRTSEYFKSAFMQKIKRWMKIKFIGYMKSVNEYYVFFKPENDVLQILVVSEKQDGRKSLVPNGIGGAWLLLKESMVMQYLSDSFVPKTNDK